MIAKAIIVKIPEVNSNIYKVRIPFFEDNKTGDFLLDAIVCRSPGVIGGYNKDDVVLVGFENDKLNKAVILGKLYTAKESEDPEPVLLSVDSLKVFKNINIPSDVAIDNFKAEDIFKLYQKTSILELKEDPDPKPVPVPSTLSYETIDIWES